MFDYDQNTGRVIVFGMRKTLPKSRNSSDPTCSYFFRSSFSRHMIKTLVMETIQLRLLEGSTRAVHFKIADQHTTVSIP